MSLIALLITTLVIAGYMRKHRVRALLAVGAAALMFPVWVAFASMVYPADPEAHMWAAIAIPVSYAWGLGAAGLGYGLMALLGLKFR